MSEYYFNRFSPWRDRLANHPNTVLRLKILVSRFQNKTGRIEPVLPLISKASNSTFKRSRLRNDTSRAPYHKSLSPSLTFSRLPTNATFIVSTTQSPQSVATFSWHGGFLFEIPVLSLTSSMRLLMYPIRHTHMPYNSKICIERISNFLNSRQNRNGIQRGTVLYQTSTKDYSTLQFTVFGTF